MKNTRENAEKFIWGFGIGVPYTELIKKEQNWLSKIFKIYIFNFLFNNRKKSVINNSIPLRFEKWEESIKYLGKPVRVCFVEGPDVKGRLNGISLATNGDEIVEAFLEVNGFLWEYWKCRPDNENS